MKTTILKIKRKEKGLKQAELAEKAKISVLSYQRYESGERIPNVYIAQEIADILQVDVDELFPISQRNSSDTNLSKE